MSPYVGTASNLYTTAKYASVWTNTATNTATSIYDYGAGTTSGTMNFKQVKKIINTVSKNITRSYWDEDNLTYPTCSNSYYSKMIETTACCDQWKTYIYNDRYGTYGTPPPPLPISERFRQILQSRQSPMLFLPSRTPVKAVAEERELRARETLRRLLGDDKFQRFLRNGFVSVQGKSGKTYQIYPGHGMTIVYDRGTPVEKLCVVLRGDFTATDSLITRYVMILHDEMQFRGLANIWKAAPRVRQSRTIDTRPLLQILQSMRAAA